jgi:DNA end-binding protein Ku
MVSRVKKPTPKPRAPAHAGPHAAWRGQLKLSLVSCPVLLFPATEPTATIRFNLLNPETHNRIRMVPTDPDTGPVERSELVKGYQYEKGKYVILEDKDFAKAKIEATHTISLESFVPAPEVDCFYTETPYYVVPDGKEAQESYAVIREAMVAEKVIGIGHVVLGQRERLVGVRPKGKGFVLNTLRTGAEMRKGEDYFDAVQDRKVDKEMVEIARAIIGKREGHFKASSYVDHYEEALMEIIQAKIKGEKPVIAVEPKGAKVVNLMDALKKSLKQEGTAPSKAAPPKARKRG